MANETVHGHTHIYTDTAVAVDKALEPILKPLFAKVEALRVARKKEAGEEVKSLTEQDQVDAVLDLICCRVFERLACADLPFAMATAQNISNFSMCRMFASHHAQGPLTDIGEPGDGISH